MFKSLPNKDNHIFSLAQKLTVKLQNSKISIAQCVCFKIGKVNMENIFKNSPLKKINLPLALFLSSLSKKDLRKFHQNTIDLLFWTLHGNISNFSKKFIPLLKQSQEEKNVQDKSSSPCLFIVYGHSKSIKWKDFEKLQF